MELRLAAARLAGPVERGNAPTRQGGRKPVHERARVPFLGARALHRAILTLISGNANYFLSQSLAIHAVKALKSDRMNRMKQ